MKKITQQKSLLEYYHFSKKEEKEYPVITKILKELTPEKIEKEIRDMQKTKLPPELQKWVKEYEKVGDRNEFIWKWGYIVSRLITLPGVPQRYHISLIKTKFLIIMFIVLLDDTADKLQNKKLLCELLKIPLEKNHININRLDKKEQKYLKFTMNVWLSIQNAVQAYPQYKKFKPTIKYDIRQLLNGMNYAYLANKNLHLINEIESQIYLSHNTPAIISYTIDLSCLPSFNIKNFGLIRKIAWHAQIMTRISNCISTWEREIKENDFTSEIFAYIIENKIISIEHLQKNKEKNIDKIKKSEAEKYFLKQWEASYNEIDKINQKLKFVGIKQILKVVEKLTILHLINRKFI